MAKTSPQLEWCVVRMGEDMNWWVDEISDAIHWDVDGLSIIDPRQIGYIIELIDPLHDYGFDPDIFEDAFYTFRIDRNLGDGRVKLARVSDNLLETEDKLFALPDILDEETGPYADFLDHIVRLRVKLLNDTFDFEQKLTADELEEEIRDEQNNSFLEGRSIHLFSEIISILEYVPAGWETDEPDEGAEQGVDEDAKAFPDLEEEEAEQADIDEDETMRWDDEEEEKEEASAFFEEEGQEGEETSLDDLDDDDEEEEVLEEEAEGPVRRRGPRKAE